MLLDINRRSGVIWY